MADQKLRLEADSFRLYNYDDDGQIVKKRGYRRIRKGEEFTVPDFVARRLLSAQMTSPTGRVRRAVVKADDRDAGEELGPVNEQASQFPEADFGSTDVAGNLISDPENKLAEQRAEARTAERSPKKQAELRQANERERERSSQSQSQSRQTQHGEQKKSEG